YAELLGRFSPDQLVLTIRCDGRARRSLLTRRSPPSDEGGWRSRGKSLLIFGNSQAPKSKIFRFTFPEIRIITLPVSRPQEGRIMIVTTRGARDAVDALASGASDRVGRKRQGVRRSRVVLAPRRWR